MASSYYLQDSAALESPKAGCGERPGGSLSPRWDQLRNYNQVREPSECARLLHVVRLGHNDFLSPAGVLTGHQRRAPFAG